MLSEALRLIRVFHDLKQQDLADKLDISKSHLSEIESGKKVPTIDIVGRYSKIFGIPMSSIMFFGENVHDGSARGTDEKVRFAIADKVVQFLKFIEAKTDGGQEGIRSQR